MFLFGILGILQVWFLPGITLLSFNRKLKFIDCIILSLPLSITLNTIIVSLLVFFKIYYQTSILILVGLELIIIFLNLYRSTYFRNSILHLENFIKLKNNIAFKFNLIDLANLVFFVFICYFGLKTLGEVIHIGDAIRSFNPWSIFWFNSSPKDFGFYTPGMSILMSVVYKFINNTDVEFFTRAILIIYPIWIFFIFYRTSVLANKFQNYIKISLLITLFVFVYIFRNYGMYIGLNEPLLFLTSSSTAFVFYLLYLYKNKLSYFEYIISGLIVISSPILKQTGFFICFIFPIFYLFFFINKKNFREVIKNTIFIIIPIFGPFIWITSKAYNILFLKTQTSNLGFIISLNQGSLLEKLENIFGFMWIPFLALIFLGLINKHSLKLFLIISLPFFALYYFYFGYDNRHISLIVPFLAINISFGVYELVNKFKIYNFKYPIYFFNFLGFISIILILLILNNYRSTERLISSNLNKKNERGDKVLNSLIYHYVDKNNFKILSIPDQMDFRYLPKIENRVIVKHDCKDLLKNEEKYYLLIKSSYCQNLIGEEMRDYYRDNKFKTLFFYNDHYLFIK
ncbi:hypothetical protein AKH19_05945 [Pelagibacteraceae bacterium GOM-A1]|nr:hypothetical protein AKH19_05945 [Pelagibacteraceae bacterium GOM-A1]